VAGSEKAYNTALLATTTKSFNMHALEEEVKGLALHCTMLLKNLGFNLRTSLVGQSV
jgi:hypothetical protein